MVTSRVWLTAAQKAELWERWKNGQSAAAISRALERKNKTGVERIVVLHGGMGRRRAESPGSTKVWGTRRDFPWHCGGPVDPADRPGPRTGAIDSKPGDQAQRRQSGLSCKPG